MSGSKYFYDKQIRRYLLQINRLFSGFQVRDGFETINGERYAKFKRVPVAYANLSTLGASYQTDNSENMLVNSPAMAFYITDIQPSTEHRQYQHYTSHSRFTEKKKDSNGDYMNIAGNKYDVRQVMPTPFEMKINLDIWTSSIDQKTEIFEQIAVYFNPGFAFRVDSSRFNMGQMSDIELESVQWSSKSVPVGTSVEIDYMTLTFKVSPVYISAPAKITRQNIIKSIVLSDTVVDSASLTTLEDIFSTIPTHTIYVSPTEHTLIISKENGKYYGRIQKVDAEEDVFEDWRELFTLYGVDFDEPTLLRVRQTEDITNEEFDVYANVYITTDNRVVEIEYDVSTFKLNTLGNINGIISGGNSNQSMFDEVDGTRYLVATDMDLSNTLWNMVVPSSSIIEKVSGNWTIVFDAPSALNDEFVLNETSGEQYKFISSLKLWQPTNTGSFAEGYWSFDVQKVGD